MKEHGTTWRSTQLINPGKYEESKSKHKHAMYELFGCAGEVDQNV
jgi:hypothetical protein